jgi:cytochrome c553
VISIRLVALLFISLLVPAVLAEELPSSDSKEKGETKAKPSFSTKQIAFFETKIRPVLATHCVGCHSLKAQQESGDAPGGNLLLDSRAGLLRGGHSGPAVVPGKPDQSPLIQAIQYDGLEMPPEKPLPENVVKDFINWVKQGAADPRVEKPQQKLVEKNSAKSDRTLWSFEKRTDPAIPEVNDSEWPKDPIDHFILTKLEAAGVSPAKPAPPRELIRRLYYDLIGLPPTAEQVEQFVTDAKRDKNVAVEQLVDKLLSKPQFGERWGRHWLDVARYGESNGDDGLGRNATFPHAWRYRDYVIDAINRDVPYDQFIQEQIAGDLLPAKSAMQRNRQLVATGFLAIGSKPAAAMNKDFAMDVVNDQINVITKGLLGLSVACARCHDHKHDPIPTRDYYALAGIFTSTETLYGAAANEKLTAPPTALHTLVSEWKSNPEPEQKKPQIVNLKFPASYTHAIQELRPVVHSSLNSESNPGLDIRSGAKFSTENFAAVKEADIRGSIVDAAEAYSVSFWFKNDLKNNARPITAYLFSRAKLSDKALPGDHLGIGGTHDKDKTGKLFVFNGNIKKQSVGGNTVIPPGTWNHVVLVRTNKRVQLYLNGNPQPEIDAELALTFGETQEFSLANRSDKFAPLQGGVAQFAAFNRSLSAEEAKQLHVASGQPIIPNASPIDRSSNRLAMGVRDRAKPADTKIHVGGTSAKLGAAVPRGFLSAYQTTGTTDGESESESAQFNIPADQSGRLQLAAWITQPDHPHTARVIVNRVWLHLFGRGIVSTPDDFGVYGDRPSHPELLDHQANRFVAEGWSLKKLIRQIVLSNTYQLSSEPIDALRWSDQENKLFGYHKSRRLDAEALRDSILQASGSLDLAPAQGSAVEKIDQLINWPPGEATNLHEASQHRSIYLCMLRHSSPPELAAFDLPVGIDVMGNREVTTLPTQSLFLMNSPFVAKESAAMADQVLAQEELENPARAQLLFRRALGRNPTEEELQRVVAYVDSMTIGTPRISPKVVWASLCQALFTTNEFRYVD